MGYARAYEEIPKELSVQLAVNEGLTSLFKREAFFSVYITFDVLATIFRRYELSSHESTRHFVLFKVTVKLTSVSFGRESCAKDEPRHKPRCLFASRRSYEAVTCFLRCPPMSSRILSYS